VKPLRFLVVPALEKGRGGGHLERSAFLTRSLRAAGREAFLWLPESGRKIPGGDGESWLPGEPWILRSGDPRLGGAENRNWAFIVLDKFQTSPGEAASWSALAPLIGIDEGGACRNSFDFLIDLLPAPKKRFSNPSNISAPSLLPLPLKRRPSFQALGTPAAGKPLRILVSFGAEDAAGLGERVAGALEKTAGPLEVACIQPGALIPQLRERLAEYDALITHFGLTAFEALHARLPVVLVSPTRRHEVLARNAGFFSLGVGRSAADRIGRHIPDPAFLRSLGERCRNIAVRYGLENPPGQSLGALLASFEPPAFRECPGCGAPFSGVKGKTPGRFPERSYRRCGRCGLIYQMRTRAGTVAYETDYFFDAYRKQYGKTYLEDFPNLVEAGKKRIALIRRLLKGGTGGLLDIGCAYGPFLSAARQEGFNPLGIDPAADAVRYVRKKLGIKALAGFFPDLSLPARPDGKGFAAITLWYVIEHFADLRPALGEINRLLALKGVLAFATPSFSGISGRKSLTAFLENSPPDHVTVWSPALCRRLLARYGFRVKKIRVTGRHPERFPLGGRLSKGGLLWRLFLLAGRLFKLGDTFECYAIKERTL
jgi:2-polyprenyl-3-methyl-5-hydroxy-6-metoxy-1,4-benzoquinol methylase